MTLFYHYNVQSGQIFLAICSQKLKWTRLNPSHSLNPVFVVAIGSAQKPLLALGASPLLCAMPVIPCLIHCEPCMQSILVLLDRVEQCFPMSSRLVNSFILRKTWYDLSSLLFPRVHWQYCPFRYSLVTRMVRSRQTVFNELKITHLCSLTRKM